MTRIIASWHIAMLSLLLPAWVACFQVGNRALYPSSLSTQVPLLSCDPRSRYSMTKSCPPLDSSKDSWTGDDSTDGDGEEYDGGDAFDEDTAAEDDFEILFEESSSNDNKNNNNQNVDAMEKTWRYIKKPLLSIGAKGATFSHGNSLRQLLEAHTAVKVKVNIKQFGTYCIRNSILYNIMIHVFVCLCGRIPFSKLCPDSICIFLLGKYR